MFKKIATWYNKTAYWFGHATKLVRSILMTLSFISVIFLYNPSGHSYYHWVTEYPWGADMQESFFVALVGVLIVGVTLFMITGTWRSTDWLGKLVFTGFAVCGGGMVWFSESFDPNNADHITNLILTILVIFALWGAIYPRLRWLFQRSRLTEDPDTGSSEEVS